MRIVVAMSGGVDSSVAAGLLCEAGHEVIGLAMKTHASAPKQNRACCTPDDMRDARRVADLLEIPFYVLNYVDLFEKEVVRPFAEAYREGRTPNPCVVCNDKVKFRPLLQRARLLGADLLATGHYARLEGRPKRLLRGRDRRKDQSYFLYRLGPAQLDQLLFPVGDLTKDEVRDHARRLGLPTADKHESQEICFVGAEGYAATVEKLGGGGKAGAVVNAQGETLGAHRGVHRFTLGQRRGLGIAHPDPLYVTGIEPDTGTVQVGPRSALLTSEVTIDRLSWTGQAPTTGDSLSVQQRYREEPQPVVVVDQTDERMTLRFENAHPKGAPGQAAVLYRGEEVVGGGTIVAPPFRARLPVVQAS